ncbi:MAG TPA: sulfotransferase [Steroidobacteraceae bacterium]|nr:sulfotransferase [Steroidobacteraceae bacterium]
MSTTVKAGRNDPCPCGSGRKYKHCHGTAQAAPPTAAAEGGELAELTQLVGMLHAGALAAVEQRCRKRLEARPLDGMLWKILSVALLRQERDAMPSLRRAAELLPRDPETHLNLGLGLAALGQRAEAVASYRQSLALNPSGVEALNALGDVLRELGERGEALALYERALGLDPRRADTLCNLGTVLFELRRIGDAEQSFRRALAERPGYVPAQIALAAVLRVQARTAEAEACCQAALAADPRSAHAISLLAELHADRGRFTEAQELFERAIALDAKFTTAYCGIAQHRRMRQEDIAWQRGVEALLAGPLPLGHQVSLRYALGKYFDDTGRYDEAFESYAWANELSKRFRIGYDRSRLTQRIDRLIGTFDATFVRERHPGVSESELPVLIVGMPRSGTSLAEQILASHPQVFGAGEVRFWDDAFTALVKSDARGEALARELPQLAREYLARLGAHSGGQSRVIDKMPANFLYLGLIHAAFPRARILHMQRHPLDTCLSIYFQNFFNMGPYANDFGNLGHYYEEYLRVMAHWRAVLPATALLEVSYEGLLQDQEGWTRRMLDFVGLPWDPRCLDFHQTERVVITASRWQVRQRLNSSSAGRWRNYAKHLTPLEYLVERAQRR